LDSATLQLQRYRCEQETSNVQQCVTGLLWGGGEAPFHCKATQWQTGAILEFVTVAKPLFFIFFSSEAIRKLIITLCTGGIKTGNLIAKLEEILRHTDFLHTFHINALPLHKLSSVKVLHL
jgi:hypothetical protein